VGSRAIGSIQVLFNGPILMMMVQGVEVGKATVVLRYVMGYLWFD